MLQPPKKPQLQLKRKRKIASLVTEENKEEGSSKVNDENIAEEGLPKEVKTDQDQDVTTRRLPTEFYPGEEYAKLNNGSEIYAKNSHGSEFALMKGEREEYAKEITIINGEEHIIEVAPKNEDGDPIYLYDANGIRYPMDLTISRPLFKVNPDNFEEYLTDFLVTQPNYPIDMNGKTYYARDAEQNEYPIQRGQTFVYAKGRDKVEIYPKKNNGDEYALTNHNKPYYAKRANKDEYYPTRIVESSKIRSLSRADIEKWDSVDIFSI